MKTCAPKVQEAFCCYLKFPNSVLGFNKLIRRLVQGVTMPLPYDSWVLKMDGWIGEGEGGVVHRNSVKGVKIHSAFAI